MENESQAHGQILQIFLDETTGAFQSYKKLAEQAVEQVSDDEFFKTVDAESNSLATICKHVGGNLKSRWTDFLTTDGEKPSRNRDAEFIADGDTRKTIRQTWENGFQTLFETLQSLTAADLDKIVQIRSGDFTVVKAINRAMMHTASHVGQIQFLAKHLRSNDWKTLSVPKNQSAEFTDWLRNKDDKGSHLEATGEFAKRDLK